MVSRWLMQAGTLVAAVFVASACQNTREGLEKDAEQAAPKVERAAERSAQAAREVAAAAAPAAAAIKDGQPRQGRHFVGAPQRWPAPPTQPSRRRRSRRP